jgi:hypothetical protein
MERRKNDLFFPPWAMEKSAQMASQRVFGPIYLSGPHTLINAALHSGVPFRSVPQTRFSEPQ